MKLIKSASGKTTIKMSKSEWTDMGKKNGWLGKQAEIDVFGVINQLTIFLKKVEDANRKFCPRFDEIDLEDPRTAPERRKMLFLTEPTAKAIKEVWEQKYKAICEKATSQIRSDDSIPDNVKGELDRLLYKFNEANTGLYWLGSAYEGFVNDLEDTFLELLAEIKKKSGKSNDDRIGDFLFGAYGDEYEPDL